MYKKIGFRCLNCQKRVSINQLMGTRHRNHCPNCLWSKHVDLDKPGDRKSLCEAGMEPIGLTFKKEGLNKYGQIRQGELMLIHKCTNQDCGKITINRIAGDDNIDSILKVFKKSLNLGKSFKEKLNTDKIELLTEADQEQIKSQLSGKWKFQ